MLCNVHMYIYISVCIYIYTYNCMCMLYIYTSEAYVQYVGCIRCLCDYAISRYTSYKNALAVCACAMITATPWAFPSLFSKRPGENKNKNVHQSSLSGMGPALLAHAGCAEITPRFHTWILEYLVQHSVCLCGSLFACVFVDHPPSTHKLLLLHRIISILLHILVL
jgi:hypothetical protein